MNPPTVREVMVRTMRAVRDEIGADTPGSADGAGTILAVGDERPWLDAPARTAAIDADTPVASALRLMVATHVRQLPVTDAGGAILGVVSLPQVRRADGGAAATRRSARCSPGTTQVPR